MSVSKIIVGIIVLVICYFIGLFFVSIIDKEDKLSKTNKAFKVIIFTFAGLVIFYFIWALFKGGLHQIPDNRY